MQVFNITGFPTAMFFRDFSVGFMVKFNQNQGEWLLDFVAVGHSWCLIHQLDIARPSLVGFWSPSVASWHPEDVLLKPICHRMVCREVDFKGPQDGVDWCWLWTKLFRKNLDAGWCARTVIYLYSWTSWAKMLKITTSSARAQIISGRWQRLDFELLIFYLPPLV